MAAARLRASVALVAATALLAGVVGATVRPAAAAPVLAADTQRSGYGFAFGRNDFGQTNPTSTATSQLGAVQLPAGGGGLLADAVSFAAGEGFVVWSDHKGAVWSLGDNTNGTSGNGTAGGVVRTPVRASGFGGTGQPRAVKVSAYGRAVDVLDSDGSVWQWGQVVNNSSSLAVQSSPSKLPFPSGATRIVDVSAGSTFSLAMDDAGRAYSWGKNDRGQLGLGSTSTSPYPSRISTLPAVPLGAQAALEAGREFGLYAISSSAGVSLYAWGRADSYQLGLGTTTTDQRSPKLVTTVASPAKLLALSGGGTHGLMLTNDGVVRTWGSNGVSTTKTPTAVADPSGALSGLHHPYTVSAGDGASFAASTDGAVAAWGSDTTGQLGRTTTGTLSTPTLVTVPGTLTASPVGVPATITSRAGATFVVVDAQATRSDPLSGYDFGSSSTTLASGQSAPSRAFTFTNVASRPLTFSSTTLDGSNPGDFAVSASTCTGTIAVDATCSLTITFRPTATGARSANLNMRFSNTLGGLPLQTFTALRGNGYTSVLGLRNFALDLAAGQPTTVSGPGNVIPLGNLSPSLIPGALPATQAAPLGKLPLGKLPLGKLPLGKLPLGKLPLGKLPLGKLPLGKLPLGKLPLGKLPLGKLPLGKLPLGKLPLLRQGGWTDLLAAYPKLRDVPIDSLTLASLVDPTLNAPDPAITTALPLERVTLSDLAVSSSSIANLSALAVLAGDLRLGQYGGVDWCADLPRLTNGGSCTDGAGLKRVLLELDLQGVSIDTTRAGGVRVSQLVADAQSTVPTPFDETVVAAVTLASTAIGGTHVGEIPLSAVSNLSAVVDCTRTSCTDLAGRSLGDADVVAALRPEATFGDLGGTLAARGITLAQLVEPFLDRSSFDWESLPVSLIPLQAYPNRQSLQLDVDVNCYQASGLSFGVKLPSGYQYVPGTTTLVRTRGTGTVALADPTPDAARGLVVSVPDSSFSSTGPIACPEDSAHLTVRLGVLPTGTAGSYRATGDVRTTALAPLTATQGTAVTVTGINEPPDLTPDGPLAGADQLVIGRISQPGRELYVPFEAAAGKVVEVTVGGQSSDLDAVLYYPVGAAADQVLSGLSAPVEVPFGEASGVEPDALHPARTVSGGGLQDVPLRTDRPIAAIASTRGTEVEQLSAVARAGSGGGTRHAVEVAGYNLATGPFTVRIRISDAPALADCAAPAVPLGTSPTATTRSGTALASGDNTAVLVNVSRLTGRYPTEATAALQAADAYLASTADTGVRGQVLQLDSDSAVRAAYAQWDAHPCDPSYANGVVRAINTFLAQKLPSSVTSLVVLGGDEQVPHARLEDHTLDGNEREVAGELALAGGNPLASAFAAGYYLSDDPYASRVPQSVLGQVVYSAQLSLGRLGETAADITRQLSAFVSSKGVADPGTAKTSVVADYEFLTSAGDATQAALSSMGYGVDRLSDATKPRWRASDLDASWLGKGTVPSVAALNMHYDQYRALPSYGSATGDQSELYTAQRVASATAALERRVVYTIGCHSALDVPDAYAPSAAQVKDFAQAYGSKGLAVMVGNLGFGYADTLTRAYSAEQQALMTQGLAKRYDLGTALLEAKRLYLSRLAGLSAYDLKSAQESILWGLPQYRLSSAAAVRPPAPATAAGTVDVLSGLTTTGLSFGSAANPLQFPTSNGVISAQATDPAVADRAPHTVSVPGRPVLPAQFAEVPQVPGLTLHSIVPTGLTSSAPVTVQAPFARPATDHGLEAQPLSSGTFPASLGHLGTILTGTETRSTAVVTPGQFTMTGAAPGTASFTAFPSSQWTAFYGSSTRVAPPTITHVAASRVPAGVSSAAVTTYDVTVVPATGRAIKRVYALALPGSGSGTWVRTELLPDDRVANHYTGGALGSLGAFYVVALDDQGDAARSTQGGAGWSPTELPATSAELVHLHVDPAVPASGWFTYEPTVTADSGWTILLDGVEVPNGTVVIGDGVHLVQLRRADGTLVPGAVPILVDTVRPVVLLQTAHASPYQLNEPVGYTALAVYGPSGGVPLTSAGSVPTGTVGTGKVLAVTATSTAGLSTTTSQPYAVRYGTNSTGILSPVLKPNGINLTVRLLTYEFRYRLVDYFDQPVTSGADTGNAVSFASISCPQDTSQLQLPKLNGPTAQPVYTGSNGVWAWDVAMPDTGVNVAVCRDMAITTNDGLTQFHAVVQIAP